jgi:hypothetical protein
MIKVGDHVRKIAKDDGMSRVVRIVEENEVCFWNETIKALGCAFVNELVVVDPIPPADLMTELLDRLLKADATLYQEMERSWEKERKAHLRSKAEGVRLAISYLEEMIRG